MEARDAIVSWLEQSDHFLRVTAPFSPSTGILRQLDHELAAFVNRALPRANWDAKHAKQMLKHYLLEYRSTAEAAVSLDEKDAPESRCRHFARLQKLHQRRDEGRGDESRPTNSYVPLVFALSQAQPNEREHEVVPESERSHSCEHSDIMTEKKTQEEATPGRDKSPPGTKRSRQPARAPVPESFRSAIAEAVSQRQKLLESRRSEPESQDSPGLQLHQRKRLSGSGFGLSDVDVRPKRSNGKRKSKPFQEPHSTRYEPGPPEGLLPPAIGWLNRSRGNSDWKRKRVYLSAKQLAFEQLKWQHEHELQQCELELLHREMKVREALAQQELKIERMRVRADIIQPMISAGASVAEIVERLQMLYR